MYVALIDFKIVTYKVDRLCKTMKERKFHAINICLCERTIDFRWQRDNICGRIFVLSLRPHKLLRLNPAIITTFHRVLASTATSTSTSHY